MRVVLSDFRRQGTAEPLQQLGQLREVPWQPGIDEEQLLIVLDEVEADRVITEAVHARYDQGRQRVLRCGCSPRAVQGVRGMSQALEPSTTPAAH
jgi:hypothetical protein